MDDKHVLQLLLESAKESLKKQQSEELKRHFQGVVSGIKMCIEMLGEEVA